MAAAAAVLVCLILGAPATVAVAQDAQAGATAEKPAAPPTLDGILRALATYDGGIESSAVWQLRDYVYARKDDEASRAECEMRLLQFLRGRATQAARVVASRHLRLIAGETAVPALAAMLADDALADPALYVLRQIPGDAASQALVRAATNSQGSTRIAVIAALGERRAAAAVPVLVSLLAQPALAEPAAIALGRIGGHDAVGALTKAYPAAPAALKSRIASALLQAVSGFELGQEKLPTYEMLAADQGLPAPLRRAAFCGRILSTDPRRAVLDMLASPDPLARDAALSQASLAFFPDTIGELCARLPRLSEGEQVILISALSGYPGDAVVTSLVDAARSPSEAVRLAAWQALSTTGGASVVPYLADAASTARGREQSAIRSALGSLKGRAIDDAIVALLEREPPDAIRGELMLAAGERRTFQARPLVADALASEVESVRLQALRALRAIGTPSDVDAVLDVLLAADGDTERAEAEKTAAELAGMSASPVGRARTVRSRFTEAESTAGRVRLLGLLGLVDDPASLPALRTGLASGDGEIVDAAARAILAWPTSDARDDIIALARNSRNETHRLLAIGALVRVVGLDRYRNPQAAVSDLRLAAELSWRPEEQKLVLGALPQFPCREALDLATGFLREDATREEAQAAIRRITERLPKEAIRQ